MKDALGNELREGDLVALQLERPFIWGRVAKIEEGGLVGLVVAGKGQISPGRVVIESKHIIDVDPRLPVLAVLALRDDDSQRAEQGPPPLPN